MWKIFLFQGEKTNRIRSGILSFIILTMLDWEWYLSWELFFNEGKPVACPLYDGILAAGNWCNEPCESDSDNNIGGIGYEEEADVGWGWG